MAVKGIGRGYDPQPLKGESQQPENGASFQESIAAVAGMSTQELMQEIGNAKDEIYKKVQKGELEESFQIGGQSFTLKEWNRLLESFDSSQDKLKALLEERLEQQKKADLQARAQKEDEEE